MCRRGNIFTVAGKICFTMLPFFIIVAHRNDKVNKKRPSRRFWSRGIRCATVYADVTDEVSMRLNRSPPPVSSLSGVAPRYFESPYSFTLKIRLRISGTFQAELPVKRRKGNVRFRMTTGRRSEGSRVVNILFNPYQAFMPISLLFDKETGERKRTEGLASE